ncbi:MAG TPA: lysophospholipid acyltransferase family protein [bacterium]|nr:lysophospholipid acyltransferase family protein [bacterium]
MVYRISKALLRIILGVLFGFRVDGREHEPAAGPVVVVSNHLSDLDPLVVGAALRRRVAFMAKHELFRVPGVRWWITKCGAFPVRRGTADRHALRTALEILQNGGVLVMFPEGTRGRDRALREPEPGAALLARRTGAALLPVAVLGTDVVLPRDAHRLRRARIAVRIGPPLYVTPPAQAGSAAAGERVSRGREELDAIGRLYMTEIARLLS